MTHSPNHLVPLLRRTAFALTAEVTRQILCPYLILLVCCRFQCPVGTGSVTRPDRLCMVGLNMKTVVGFNPGLVKTVTSMETSAPPEPKGLE